MTIAAALPLILWFAYGALQLRAVLVHDGAMIVAWHAPACSSGCSFSALLAAACFDLLLIYLLVVRDQPVAKSRGVLPRIFGFVGTFTGRGHPAAAGGAPRALAMQILAAC